jgi:hypothetical protein
MRVFQGVLVSVCACALLGACASAPISLVGTDLADGGLRANPEQAALLDAASALEATYRDHGWIRENTAMETARGWMDRLTGQSVGSAAPDADPAQGYILEAQLLELPASDAVSRLVSDLALAASHARLVDQSARALSGPPGQFSRAALTRDLGEVETTITYTSDAVELFDAAILRVASRLSADQVAQVNSGRDQLAFLAESLRDRADEIARQRRLMRDLPPLS